MYYDALYSYGTENGKHSLGYEGKTVDQELTAEARSNLACLISKVDKTTDEAIHLAREAVERDPTNALHYLNYGRILYIAGDTKAAIDTFRKGLDYGMHFEILRVLEFIRLQRPHIIKRLPENHFINRCLGPIMTKLRAR